MDIFPTQYSLLSAAALNDVLEELYGLKSMTSTLLIHNVSDTYILENGAEHYIFKIYRAAHRSLAEIRAEAELLNILHEKGASVSYPLYDLKGNQIQSFNAAEGLRYGMLFSYAEGKVCQMMNDTQLATVGREMGRLHQLTSTIQLIHPRKEYNINSMLIDTLERVKPAFAELPEEYEYLRESNKKVMAMLARFDTASFGFGYCHYDFLPKNFHFENDDKLTFFDFDFAGKGYLVNDLASFYAHFFLQVLFNVMSQQEADRSFKVFLKNYQKERSLSDAEIASIPYFGYAWWIFYMGFHYDNFEDWSNFFFGPKFLKERVGWIRKWVERYVDKAWDYSGNC